MHLFGDGETDGLYGYDGNDVLRGGDGTTTPFSITITTYINLVRTFQAGLYGGAGDDRLYGQAGNDYLDGGAGLLIFSTAGPGSTLPWGGATAISNTGSTCSIDLIIPRMRRRGPRRSHEHCNLHHWRQMSNG